MTDQPTPQTACLLAHDICALAMRYARGQITSSEMLDRAAALIEQDRHAVRCDVARQASALVQPVEGQAK